MKKVFKNAAFFAATILMAVSFSACNKTDETQDEANIETKDAIIKQYLNHTVYPTYANLASKAEALVDDLETLKANKTQANLEKACASFLEARHWWEMSEAFLFGAASDFGIDPHIDSWPLDETEFNRLMNNPEMLEDLDGEDGAIVARERLGNALLGFHGLEYVLFRDGQARPIDEINNDMMIYAVAVAGDLRNSCFQLEASWNADAPQAHTELMEELEFNTTVNGSNNTYGENMTLAGQAGSTYATRTQALQAILDGCMQNGLNPAMWAGSDWAPTGLYGNTNHPKRYTYALTRGPLQDAPGANAIWNITNVTHRTKMGHYMTAAYATVASQDPDVQAEFYNYFPQFNLTGNVETDIYNYLMMNDQIPDSLKVPEMTDQDYINFMVWHRGLAVPAARNLSDPEVQRGKQLFTEMGCAYCHRPSWHTGDDMFTDPTGFFADGDPRLPRYPNQKIWPYSDYIQHKLHMENDIRTGWCRTTPLWGRGLSAICTGRSDRLHDCRAQTVIEAIMWHGNVQSDARRTVEKFRMLDKKDRDAVVKFIEAI